MTDPGEYVIDTITIRRVLTTDGDGDEIQLSIEGESGLTMRLGMLELSKDTLLRMVDADDGEEDNNASA